MPLCGSGRARPFVVGRGRAVADSRGRARGAAPRPRRRPRTPRRRDRDDAARGRRDLATATPPEDAATRLRVGTTVATQAIMGNSESQPEAPPDKLVAPLAITTIDVKELGDGKVSFSKESVGAEAAWDPGVAAASQRRRARQGGPSAPPRANRGSDAGQRRAVPMRARRRAVPTRARRRRASSSTSSSRRLALPSGE